MEESQRRFVAEQYGSRAAEYVASAVHAEGAELERLAAEFCARPAERVLDLGCGGGHVSYRVAAGARLVVACDPTQSMLRAVRQVARARGLAGILPVQAAAERLPFAAACFDAVLSRFSAHHWQDLRAGLAEARRVSRSAARGFFIDVLAPAEPESDSHLQAVELLRDPSHGRDYRRDEWLAALRGAGFAVDAITEWLLRMEFISWTARTRTAALQQQAIRALQAAASACVRRRFAIGDDGSFDLPVACFTVRAV
jgi:ubiquinone/menaquinone biosynthesis C-methylase UbiE